MRRTVIIIAALFAAAVQLQAQEHELWYDKPASHWLEALPVGNSHLGAMVYGGTDVEEIQLNEETFWAGSPHNNNSAEAKENLAEVRQLIFDGREKDAHAIIDKHFFKGPHGMRYLTLGSLKLDFGHTEGQPSGNRRPVLYEKTCGTDSGVSPLSYAERAIGAMRKPNVVQSGKTTHRRPQPYRNLQPLQD